MASGWSSQPGNTYKISGQLKKTSVYAQGRCVYTLSFFVAFFTLKFSFFRGGGYKLDILLFIVIFFQLTYFTIHDLIMVTAIRR